MAFKYFRTLLKHSAMSKQSAGQGSTCLPQPASLCEHGWQHTPPLGWHKHARMLQLDDDDIHAIAGCRRSFLRCFLQLQQSN